DLEAPALVAPRRALQRARREGRSIESPNGDPWLAEGRAIRLQDGPADPVAAGELDAHGALGSGVDDERQSAGLRFGHGLPVLEALDIGQVHHVPTLAQPE